MKEKLHELFSAYLDGRGSPKERKVVETTIQASAAAKEEFEAMRSFHLDMQGAKPAEIQAPPEFRQNIMRRIQTETGGGSQGTGGLGKGLFFNSTTSWVVMGIVLTGLLGTLIVRDQKNQNQSQKEQQARTQEVLPLSEYEVKSRDMSGLPEIRLETVNPQDIQIAQETDGLLSEQQGKARLTGEVYVAGSGRARRKGGFVLPVAEFSSSQLDLSEHAKSSARLGLENFGQWSTNQIRVRLEKHAVEGNVQAGEIIALAQQHNLHPGLLLAAKKQLPQQELDALAVNIRGSLNTSVGKTEQERLLAVIKALAGKAEWTKQWQEIIKDK